MLNQVVSQPVSMQLRYRLFFDYAFIRSSMRIFLNQFVMHADHIVERFPGPKHADHDTMLLFGIFVDIVEILTPVTCIISNRC